MKRRNFLAAGVGGVLAAPLGNWRPPSGPGHAAATVRDYFPRLQHEVFLNAAGGTPLGTFAQDGLRAYEAFWQLGPGEGRGEAFAVMLEGVRSAFARLIGAEHGEIALVHCTKAGEQIVLDGVPALRERHGNVVTDDLHFSGSLHNLEGMRRAGLDVRIVKQRDWTIDLDAMAAAIDDDTALVTVSLVSNVNGRVEPIRALADLAHERGALVFADIIQAAGIVPIDVRAMGIDCAACSGYKWLFGPHGVGFLYVRRELQGAALPDYLFPGHVRHNYRPWVDRADEQAGDYLYRDPEDARRYQPGHVSYLGYAALWEGLKLIDAYGVERARDYCVALTERLQRQVDPGRYRSISPDTDRVPIATYLVSDPSSLRRKLQEERIVVSLGSNRLRVSPAIYNTEADVDLLARVLDAAR
jgi:selenocysteine lyase/cysteine desulfurase